MCRLETRSLSLNQIVRVAFVWNSRSYPSAQQMHLETSSHARVILGTVSSQRSPACLVIRRVLCMSNLVTFFVLSNLHVKVLVDVREGTFICALSASLRFDLLGIVGERFGRSPRVLGVCVLVFPACLDSELATAQSCYRICCL
ncbi:hypothetical protein M758_1G213600 [Ceratodon purpureus]|nr:hypothetical protein M758_1G213600 [Ceratodon purpureus]